MLGIQRRKKRHHTPGFHLQRHRPGMQLLARVSIFQRQLTAAMAARFDHHITLFRGPVGQPQRGLVQRGFTLIGRSVPAHQYARNLPDFLRCPLLFRLLIITAPAGGQM